MRFETKGETKGKSRSFAALRMARLFCPRGSFDSAPRRRCGQECRQRWGYRGTVGM